MGTNIERSKKKVQLWKKAIVHFSLCFVMGFFTGFAPSGKDSIFSTHIVSTNNTEYSAHPIENLHQTTSVNRSLITKISEKQEEYDEDQQEEEKEQVPVLVPRKLVIIVTPSSTKDRLQKVLLRRMANTIRLVPQPLLWIVLEGPNESKQVSEMLRKTGIMYRHLVSTENFTDSRAEMDHMRNIALKHIEHHRLTGIVHFAGLSNVYDLSFFTELRKIEVFGTWPMAFLASSRKNVIIEGPVCDSSQIIGWHLRKINNKTDSSSITTLPIHISSFAFNSSILWDPERWGRTSSVQTISQNSMKFVKQVVLEDEAGLKGIPAEDCSKIMLWRFRFPKQFAPTNPILTIALDGNPT